MRPETRHGRSCTPRAGRFRWQAEPESRMVEPARRTLARLPDRTVPGHSRVADSNPPRSPSGYSAMRTVLILAMSAGGIRSWKRKSRIPGFPFQFRHLLESFPRKRIHRLIQGVMNPET